MQSKKRQILLFGGSPSQLSFIFSSLEPSFAIHPLPFDAPLPVPISEPSIIIVFHQLPQFNALEKLPVFQSSLPEVPLLILSNSPDPRDIIQAFRMGVADFLILPNDAKELVQQVHQLAHQPPNVLLHRKKWTMVKNSFRWVVKCIEKIIPQNETGRSLPPSADLLGISGNWMEQRNSGIAQQPDLQIHFFGKFKVLLKGQAIDLPPRKAKALMAYLLYKHKKPIHREKLMATFWPYSPNDCARNSLNVAIHTIRKVFEKPGRCRDFVIFSRDFYSFDTALSIETDTDQFFQFWNMGQQFEQKQGMKMAVNYYQKAASIYEGDFLEDILGEEWVEIERENLREIYLMILENLSKFYFQEKQFLKAVGLCKKMLALDNCLERVHRRLMQCYEKMNMRDKALRQFVKCHKVLFEELKVEPSSKTVEIFERIRS